MVAGCGGGLVYEDQESRDGWACVVVASWDGLECGDVVCLDGCEDLAS